METDQLQTSIRLAWIFMIGLSLFVYLLLRVYQYNARRFVEEKNRLEKERELASFRATVHAEERQKENISKNIHDQVITLLTASKRGLEAYYSEESRAAAPLKNSLRLIDNAVEELQSVCRDLLPHTFLNFGLFKAIELHLSRLNENEDAGADMVVSVDVSGNLPFDKSDQLIIYRLCLEILNNLFRHAKYTYLRLTVTNADDELKFEFEHDGVGVNNGDIEAKIAENKGLGLLSIASRLLLLKGGINYVKDQHLSQVVLTVPFRK